MDVDHEELERLIAAYVLGAAEPDEARRIEAHLEACASCREVSARLGRVISAVPLATEESRPPSRLRTAVLAAAAAHPPSGARPQLPTRRFPRPARLPLASRFPAWPAAAAALVVAAFGLGAGLGLAVGQHQQPAPAPTTAQYSLAGSGSLAAASGRVIELKRDGITLVDFSGLPQPAAGRVYELWIIPGSGSPLPAGVFVPDAGGSKVLLLDRSLAGAKLLAVTSEPGPAGSPAPTEQPSLAGKVD